MEIRPIFEDKKIPSMLLTPLLFSSPLHIVSFSNNYNLSDELGIPSVDNSEPLTMNELPDDEYRHMVQTLNKEKKKRIFLSCIASD